MQDYSEESFNLTYPKFKILYKVNDVSKESVVSAKSVDKAKALIYISESESAKNSSSERGKILCGKINFIKIEEI